MPPKVEPQPPEAPAALDKVSIAAMNVYTLRNTLKEWKVKFDDRAKKEILLKLVNEHNETRVKGKKSARPQGDSDYQAFQSRPKEANNPTTTFEDTPEGRKLYRRSVYQERFDPRPPSTEETALILFRYRRGDTTSVERDDEFCALNNRTPSSTDKKVTEDPKTGIDAGVLSSRAFENNAFQKIRVEYVGEVGAPLISLEIFTAFNTYPKSLPAPLATHFNALITLHPELNQLFISSTYERLKELSKVSFADPALGAAYSSFLGHLAAIFYLKNTGFGSKTISGVARSFFCTKSQMIEGSEKMHKNTYDDPVSAFSALPWWKSPEPCELCYHTNFRYCFTHDTAGCKPVVRKQGVNGGGHKNNSRGGSNGNFSAGGRGGGAGIPTKKHHQRTDPGANAKGGHKKKKSIKAEEDSESDT